jgi:hypothetical protein
MFTGTAFPPMVSPDMTVQNPRPWFTTTSSKIDPRPVRIVNGGGAGAVGVDLIPAGFMGKTSRGGGGSLPARVLQFGGKFSFLKLLAS